MTQLRGQAHAWKSCYMQHGTFIVALSTQLTPKRYPRESKKYGAACQTMEGGATWHITTYAAIAT